MNRQWSVHLLIGAMGSARSGGQCQRLFLARALYKRPKVLVLDEATSSLDVACEHQIADTLKVLNITRIIISHRTETIKSADRVAVCIKGAFHMLKLERPGGKVPAGGTDDHAKQSTVA